MADYTDSDFTADGFYLVRAGGGLVTGPWATTDDLQRANGNTWPDGTYIVSVEMDDGDPMISNVPSIPTLEIDCAECGEPFVIGGDGVSQHLTPDGDFDYEADADHTPFDYEDGLVDERHDHSDRRECQGIGCLYGDH